MKLLLRAARAIDGLNGWIGRQLMWLVLAAVLISAGNAVVRKLLDTSSNAWLEIQWQMFAGIFLLGTAHVLKLNEHVRVDIFYGGASPRTKLWIDTLGLIFFLFPACLLVVWFGVPWFLRSFAAGEMSANAGGLPLWPVKALLPFGFSLLFLQGVSELIKRIAALRGEVRLSTDYEKPVQ